MLFIFYYFTQSFAAIMQNVQQMKYDTILFDTAPTGHTLRLLSFPSVLEQAFQKLSTLKERYGGIIQQMTAISGIGQNIDTDALMKKFLSYQETIELINRQFKDPNLTTFVCVCISEFLSLYETERLVQTLSQYEIDTHNIVVNQILMTPSSEHGRCKRCTARQKMQQKYLDQIEVLYEDFHVIKMPQLNNEVRGVKSLELFADMLI